MDGISSQRAPARMQTTKLPARRLLACDSEEDHSVKFIFLLHANASKTAGGIKPGVFLSVGEHIDY